MTGLPCSGKTTLAIALKRTACMARDLSRDGNLVIASFVSPTDELRDMVMEIIGSISLVYVKCGLEECRKRDVKGMYQRAMKGEIKEFTGISAPFEEPNGADIIVDTEKDDVENCVSWILESWNR